MPRDQGAGPLNAARATTAIRACGTSSSLAICYKIHAKDQLAERSLGIPDVLHILKHGFVYDEAEASTRSGFFKYQIECTTPNSNGRIVRLVVIPDFAKCFVKIVTVMWKDEPRQRS